LKKLYFLIFIIFFSVSKAEDYLVETSSGISIGYLNNGVINWDDIPYAQPPIENLRWKAPREVKANSNIIKKRDNNFCMQRTSSLGGSAQFSDKDISGTEDCLYLDIFAPSKKSTELLPVMFWIHGGGNTSGLKDLYDFTKLVKKHDVIVVRINYRLGPFGWFTHPAIQDLQDGIDKTSNFGTLDIIAALEWVNNNISLFGGDSENITIFGESAGGHNVLSLLVSSKAKGLFNKAISMSGYTTSISQKDAYKPEKKSNTSSYSSWSVVNKIIKNKSYDKEQSYFSNKEIRDILYSLSEEEFYGFYSERENYEEIPLLTDDGIVIPSIGLRKALANRDYVNNVPTILGSNRDEVKIWLAFSEYLVDVDYSLSGSLFSLPKVIIKDESAYEAFNYYRSAAWKLRGVDEPLRSLTLAGNKNLYSYRFDWDDQRKFIIGDFKQLFGAGHALEIPLLLGNTMLVGGPPISNFMYPRGISRFYTSRNMMKFWTNFAKYGKPGKSSNKIEWTPYEINTDKESSFMILDNKRNLKMRSDYISYKTLSEELYLDKRLNEEEKCVIALQMFTFVGNDLYNENIKNYPGVCDRNSSEQFIINNASTIEID
tara:strand:+ start:619 stop:2415 length:1797 start_codon:yes stop_codon:yes gene_type:complete